MGLHLLQPCLVRPLPRAHKHCISHVRLLPCRLAVLLNAHCVRKAAKACEAALLRQAHVACAVGAALLCVLVVRHLNGIHTIPLFMVGEVA